MKIARNNQYRQRHLLPMAYVALGIVFSFPVQATDYYVATDGQDTNSGSSASAPLENIQTAINRARPGDTINIAAGTYNLTASLSIWQKSGDQQDWLTINGAAGSPTIIDASSVRSDKSGIFVGGPSSYIRLSGLVVRNAPNFGIAIMKSHDIQVLNSEFYGNRKDGVWAHGPGYNILFSGLYVHDNVMENVNNAAGESGLWDQGIALFGVSNSMVANCRVIDNWGEGIDVLGRDTPTSDNVVRGNLLKNNFSVSLYNDHSQNSIFERNVVINDNPAFNRKGMAAIGMAISDEKGDANMSRGVAVRDNIFVNSGQGFRYGAYGLGLGLKDVSVTRNTFVDPVQDAIHIDNPPNGTNSGNKFEYNIFYVTRPNSQAVTILSPLDGLAFDHNLWFGHAQAASSDPDRMIADPKFKGTCAPESPRECYRPAIDKATYGAQVFE
jgi:parallel beta helix pectate lyase-like protein/uncharacterized protein DUF1565